MDSNILETSLRIAVDAHYGQSDKAGEPYIFHCIRVAERMSTKIEKSVALLHDVLEDTDITSEYLITQGIPIILVTFVETLTKKKDDDYSDYITRIGKSGDLLIKVKIADIEDNINVLRLNALTEKDLGRISKYHRAWTYLNEIRYGAVREEFIL